MSNLALWLLTGAGDLGRIGGNDWESMHLPDITLTVKSWNRFVTRNLVIVPELVGAIHEFRYGEHRITITLPSKRHITAEPLEGELLTFNSYREVDGEKIPSNFHVHAVDVAVLAPREVVLPEGILKQRLNAYEIVPKPKQQELDQVAKDYTGIAEKVFDLWIRTLRWKCDDSSIGRPEITGHKSGWGTYLVEPTSGQQIWAWREPEIFLIYDAIRTEIWNDVQSVLNSGTRPPIFLELMFDAIEHMRIADVQRATVDMAVACESYIRMLVETNLPPQLNDSVRKYIDEANIRIVLTRFVPDILGETELQTLRKIETRLHRLFDARNRILHSGKVTALQLADCESFLEATRTLFTLKSLNS